MAHDAAHDIVASPKAHDDLTLKQLLYSLYFNTSQLSVAFFTGERWLNNAAS